MNCCNNAVRKRDRLVAQAIMAIHPHILGSSISQTWLRFGWGGLLACALSTSLVAGPPDQPSDHNTAGAPATPSTEPVPPTANQLAEWIGQLGHSSYAIRQSAAERLMAAGAVARDALSKESDSPDPETRAAARRIIALIDTSEANRRLAEFAADTDGSRGITLPGWTEFGEIVGQDEAARALFVDMQRHEAPLLAEVFGPEPREGKSSWDDRLMRLLNVRPVPGPQAFAPPLGSCATMMFLGTVPNADVNDTRANYLFGLALRPPLREALQAHHTPNTLRKLVVAWIIKCPNHTEPALRDRLTLMLIYGFEEGLPLPEAIVRGGPEYLAISPALRASAALAVGRFGSKDDVSILEPMLDDETVFAAPNGPQGLVGVVQVRDVALASMLHLTNQEPKDYGFAHVRLNPQTLFEPISLSLDNNEDRISAMAKWHAWKAVQASTITPPQ
jgi:hypothetical protein